MAKNVQINIQIDSSDGKRSLGVLNKEGQVVLKTLGDMREASAALEEQLEGVKVGTKEYQDLRAELVKVNKEIKNQELAMEALDNEQVASELKSVAGGLADMAGGLVLIGASQEDVEKVVQTIAQVEGVTKAVTGAIEAWQSGMKLLRNATKAQAAAQAVLNVIMSANPIGIIVVGIGLLIAAFVAFRKPIVDFISNWENLKMVMLALLGPIGWIIIAYQKLFGEEAKQAAAREEAERRRRELHEAELARIAEAIEENKKAAEEFRAAKEKEIAVNEKKIEILENEGKASYALRLQVLEDSLAIQQSYLDEATTYIDLQRQKWEENLKYSQLTEEAFREQMKAQGVDLAALEKESNEIIQDLQLNVELSESEITKFKREEYQKRAEDAKEAADAAIKEQQRIEKEIMASLQRIEAAEYEYLLSKETQMDQELIAVENHYQELIAEAEKLGIETALLEEALQAKKDEIRKKYHDNEGEENRKALERIKKQREQDEKDNKERYDRMVEDAANSYLTLGEKIKGFFSQTNSDVQEMLGEQIQGMFQKVADNFNLISGYLMQAMDLLSQYMQQKAEEQAYAREQSYKDETNALKSQLANREISQREYEAKLAAMEQRKQQEELAAKRKAFKQEKAMNIVRAVMSTAQAVLQALGGSPPPLSFILAGINAALGAVQIGIIASQKFKAARGGIVPGRGPSNVDSVPSMLAPGEAVINAGATSAFGPLLSAINQSNGGVPLVPASQSPATQTATPRVFTDNKETPMVKAYVVESDMTDTQKRVRRIEDSVSFG